MKLTKEQALILCADIWNYAGQKGIAKAEAIIELGISFDMSGNCPCCHYVLKTLGKMNCSLCPTVNLWPDGFCLGDSDSPYLLYVESCGNSRHNALAIRDGAIEALEKLWENGE